MFGKVFGFLGDSDEKAAQKFRYEVEKKINPLEAEWERLSDDGLRAKTQEFRQGIEDAVWKRLCASWKGLSEEELRDKTPEFRKLYEDAMQAGRRDSAREFKEALQSCEDLDESFSNRMASIRDDIASDTRREVLEEILPKAFATVREAARRTIGQRHFDEQIMGGIALHQGKIAEMKTGEGKTLVATLPVYLNALAGKGVHVVTVNDYLAHRDPQWMGPIYHLLGLSVGCLQHQASYLYDPDQPGGGESPDRMRPVDRRTAYEADITYGTNNEFGFDYLRDNMVVDILQKVQRGLHYAIVDEVDNILIDEARTPLIISGAARESSQEYVRFAKLAPRLREEEDFTVDAKRRAISLTDSGVVKMEQWLNVTNLL